MQISYPCLSENKNNYKTSTVHLSLRLVRHSYNSSEITTLTRAANYNPCSVADVLKFRYATWHL